MDALVMTRASQAAYIGSFLLSSTNCNAVRREWSPGYHLTIESEYGSNNDVQTHTCCSSGRGEFPSGPAYYLKG